MGESRHSLGELHAWLQGSPPGTLVDARALAQALAASVPEAGRPTATPLPTSWRERLWLVPADTRLGVAELLEALGRTRLGSTATPARAARTGESHTGNWMASLCS